MTACRFFLSMGQLHLHLLLAGAHTPRLNSALLAFPSQHRLLKASQTCSSCVEPWWIVYDGFSVEEVQKGEMQ
jgi:hypothetical protein